MLAKTLGQAARGARERLGLTQAQVADMLGLAHVVYNRLENAKMLPSVITLVQLCEALRVTSDELLGRSGTSKGSKAKASAEDPPSVHQLLALARKLDEPQRQALVTVARAMQR
ncbi:MAG TPA: helix-turn-helix transcriptional regulator [Hyalangium sp.]|nr:helix-turn-helix transcriptional regulator [Hyalangium sp.]